jgi:hypothetical protein
LKESTKHKALRSFLFITLGLLLLPSVNGQEPPVDDEKPCLFYAYTSSEQYNFLIQNNSKLFGSEIQIIHNCEYLQVNLEGEFYARSNNSLLIDIGEGFHNLTITTNEQSRDYSIEIFPDRLEWEGEYARLFEIPKTEFISIDTSNSRENWASILSIVIVWVLTTYVYWKLIESYVNKNFIEEVVK